MFDRTMTTARDVTSIYFGEGWQWFALRNFYLSLFCILVAVVDLMVLGPVSCPVKYTVLPFLPCKMADFQG